MPIGFCLIDDYRDRVVPLDIGPMDKQCDHCGAFRFKDEKTTICCHNGKIRFVDHVEPHPMLAELFSGSSDESKAFLKKIRKYNQAFAFTSMRSNLDTNLASDRDGVYTFRVNGELYHRMGSGLGANQGQEPKFSEIYFMDPDAQSNRRMEIFSDLDAHTVAALHNTFTEHNALVQQFKTARELSTNNPNIVLSINGSAVPAGEHPRRYNSASASEVAAVLLDDENVTNRDIVLRRQGGGLLRINELHPAYNALSYPLFFPEGRQGWSVDFKKQTNVTLKSYVQYQMQNRPSTNVLHLGGKLYQQYVVDQYLRIEAQNLMYIRSNQRQLRAECYQGITDALASNDDRPIGHRIVLPPTTVGSPRYMQQRFQDSMALVRKFGKPDLFITMTCNPNWPEIVAQLRPHQTAQDRFDIADRVFHIKLHKLIVDIEKKGVLGVTVAHVYTIEFQKRGLPHAHILIWLETKPNEETYDKIVCAEIPDPVSQPRLYKAVASHMMHGPCGIDNPDCPCMKDGQCTKDYPKDFCHQTVVLDNGYIKHRRRNTGRVIMKRARGGHLIELDNRSVVPYNIYLLAKYDCHINVEICNSVQSVKYLHKYVYKGPDRAVLEGDDVDEIRQYLEGRYVSAHEAAWRILGFETHGISHSVVRLAVHLPDQQFVAFNANASVQAALRNNERTMLTEFFRLNQSNQRLMQLEDPAAIRPLTYTEFPQHYT